jgi:succinate-semialdehyde dehydrogenase
MPLFRVDDFDAAVALANDTDYGLTATLFSRDPAEIDAARERIRCGGLFVNAMSRSDPRLPFGGVGESGFGRELGRAGILSFCNVRTYWID